MRGLDYEDQAEQIRELMTRYNVTHIGIDNSGIGDSVYQLLLKFFPQVMAYKNSVEVRINKGRLEYDNGAKEITASGRQITYVDGRNGSTGHADLAWATMHALDKAPLDSQAVENEESFLEIQK